MCDKTEKRVFYLDGTAACFKSSILSRLNEEGVCYTSSSDLTDLRESFPALYTRKDGVQFNTIAWYSMYQTQLFLDGKMGAEYTVMCCDRSPLASFVYGIINKKDNKLTDKELVEIIPHWIIDYFKSTNAMFLIDSDIKAVKERLVKRGGFDVHLATNEYFLLQNNYFRTIAELCDIPIIDIKGRDFLELYEYIKSWISNKIKFKNTV